MEPISRTGGNQSIEAAVARQRLARLADEAAKYSLPGVTAAQGEEPTAPPPMNLAQLRAWVEQHDGGLDLLA